MTRAGPRSRVVTPITRAAGHEDPFRAFVEQSIQGIVIFDDNWSPLFVNQAYAELFGYRTPTEILAMESIASLIASEDRARMRAYREARMRGRRAPNRYDFIGLRKDGSRFTLEAIVTRVEWLGAQAIQTTVNDVTMVRRLAREHAANQSRLTRQHQALLDVARFEPGDTAGSTRFYEMATQAACDTLECSRASVWLFDATDTLTVLADRFHADRAVHTTGHKLAIADYPDYFAALVSDRTIAAADARNHPATRCFADGYFAEHDVRSVLDAPIRSGGEVFGFFSCELAGEARAWRQDEEGFVASMADLVAQHVERSRRQLSESRLLQSEARYRHLFQAAPIALWEEDWSEVRGLISALGDLSADALSGALRAEPALREAASACIRIVDVNATTLRLLGATQRGLCKAHLVRELVDMPEVDFDNRLRMFLTGRRALAATTTLRRLNGEMVDVRIHIEVPEEHAHDWSRVYVALQDVTETEALSRALAWQATHDSLTGLVNRREFERRLGRALASAEDTGRPQALAFLDLDQFKVVNDTSGHVAGDQLLTSLSSELRRAVRRHDTVARLGGDEFAVLMEDCTLEQAQRVTESLREVVEQFRFQWEQHEFALGVSIGLVAIDGAVGDLHRVLADADAACYSAKSGGRNRVHVYAPGDEDISARRGEAEWITRIQRALEEDAFALVAQPIVPVVGAGDGRRRFEVLLRMRTPTGLAAPGVFMPAAERYGLSTRLDRWVVNTTLTRLETLLTGPIDAPVLSINLSGRSLGDDAFREFLFDRVRGSSVDAGTLVFEITESAAIANFDKASRLIEEVRGLGCKFALDDFGRGLSSFAYLKMLPVDVLKIDGMFVRGIASDDVDLSMVRTINEVGHALGLYTVAEYVEDDLILERLVGLGVDYAQGFGIGTFQALDDAIKGSG